MSYRNLIFLRLFKKSDSVRSTASLHTGYFKTNELRKILGELIELDNKYKSGKIDINIGLEAMLCAYI